MSTLETDTAQVRTALGLMRSIIRSGEAWSDTAEREFQAALNAVRSLEGSQERSERQAVHDSLTFFQAGAMLGLDRKALPPFYGDARSEDPRSVRYYADADPLAEAEQALGALRAYFYKRHERLVAGAIRPRNLSQESLALSRESVGRPPDPDSVLGCCPQAPPAG